MKYQSPLNQNGDDKVVSSSGDDPDLDKFFSGIHTIDNPEYSPPEPAERTEYDYFIKNRSEESDSLARVMINLNKQVKTLRGEKKFKEARAIQPKINDILDFIKTENENRIEL